MIKDITIGQYYQEDSVIHRLDPRVKLAATFLYIIMLFAFDGVFGYLLAGLALMFIVKLSKVPPKFILRGMKPIFFILIFTLAFNLFLIPGEIIIQFWVFTITKEGLETAIRMAIRLIFLIAGSSIMTLTTTPTRLTDGLEKSMGWMNAIKVPVHEISMMMSIALRFIPILVDETDKIMKAQISRGADFENGNVIKRAKGMIPLLVPLFIAAFRRAEDLAMAMESRCYRGGKGRTKMKPLKYVKRDYLAYIIICIYILAVVVLNIAQRMLLPGLI